MTIMIRKTLFSAIAFATLAGGSAFAGGYDYNYNHTIEYNPPTYETYQPQYKKVCEPVYETKYVYDPYTYRYIAKQILVGEKCFLVEIH
jgi:hypothetical protein